MNVLDCSSLDSTLSSLSLIIGSPQQDLIKNLNSFEYEIYTSTKRSGGMVPDPYEKAVLLSLIRGRLSEPPIPDATVWFHSTRVPRSTDFQSTGLLPLKACLPAIENTIRQIASDLGVYLPGGSFGNAMSYSGKMQSLNCQGPDAFLIRDTAMNPLDGSSFLDAPEIVRDLAEKHGGNRSPEVLDEYKKRTSPCIVSFISKIQRADVLV